MTEQGGHPATGDAGIREPRPRISQLGTIRGHRSSRWDTPSRLRDGDPARGLGNDVFLHALRSGAGASLENPREHSMFNRRALLSLLASIGILIGGGIAVAKNQEHKKRHKMPGAELNQKGK